MKRPFMAVLLGVLVLFVISLVTGCDTGLLSAAHDKQGTGSTTTSTGSAGDIDVQQSCCTKVAQDPFEGPELFVISTKDDPKDQTQPCEALGLAPGFTAHADPIVPDSTCPTCECSPAACALPQEMHALSGKCLNADGATATDFSPSPGWEGTCDDSSPIPADLQCGSGPCVESLTISAVHVDPCKPIQDGEPEIPAVTWETTAQQCLLADIPDGGCGAGEVCVPFVPLNSTLCLWTHGLYKCEDPHYPRQIVVYDNVKDDRACSPCACGAANGADCSAFISVFKDDGCSALVATVTIELDQPVCVDLPSGSALLSKGAFFQVDKPGMCAMSGGALTGGVDLGGPLTLCCQPDPSIPG